MKSGRLRHVITRTRQGWTVAADGTPGDALLSSLTLRAELVERRAVSTVRAQGAQAEVAAVFRVRMADVLTGDRVVFEGYGFEVAEVQRVGRHGLELRCVDLVADGGAT